MKPISSSLGGFKTSKVILGGKHMSTWKDYETLDLKQEEATAEELERLKSQLFGNDKRQQFQVHKRVSADCFKKRYPKKL